MEAKQRIRDFIVDTFLFGSPETSFHENDSFMERGIIDSTGILELVSFIEGEFKIEVKDEELVPDNLDSIEKISAYITRKKGG